MLDRTFAHHAARLACIAAGAAVAVSLSGRDRLGICGVRVRRACAEMMQELTLVAFRLRGDRITVAAVIALGVCASMRAQGPVDEVDPTIGNVSILLEPTRPTAYLPNSMVRMYPMRKDALDDQIQYFPSRFCRIGSRSCLR